MYYWWADSLYASWEFFKFRYVVLLYKAQASLMYIVYSAKGRFCAKHPHQRTVGKLWFGKRRKYKLFWSLVMYLWTRVNPLSLLLLFLLFPILCFKSFITTYQVGLQWIIITLQHKWAFTWVKKHEFYVKPFSQNSKFMTQGIFNCRNVFVWGIHSTVIRIIC